MPLGCAGIGRTGVLVAVDIALRQLLAAKSPAEARSAVDCKAIVQELRRCADPCPLSAPVGFLQETASHVSCDGDHRHAKHRIIGKSAGAQCGRGCGKTLAAWFHLMSEQVPGAAAGSACAWCTTRSSLCGCTRSWRTRSRRSWGRRAQGAACQWPSRPCGPARQLRHRNKLLCEGVGTDTSLCANLPRTTS